MPLALLALTISAFAIGTTEFVIVGLVPTIAEQLAISLPSAGLLVSIYALGVAVGAPVLTALTGRFARKKLLVALMVLFTAGNILAWQAPDYTTLVIARLLTGLAHGVFFSIGSTIATSLVPKEKAASAIAIMFGGLTVALVTGVPLGTFIGQHFGWRETFLAVSLLGVIALVASLLLVPSSIPGRASASLSDQVKVLTPAPAADLCRYGSGLWRCVHCVHFPCTDDAGTGWFFSGRSELDFTGLRYLRRNRQYLGRQTCG